eukprot:scaffold257005_cov19-Tisochrysis_lutea.AAC.1
MAPLIRTIWAAASTQPGLAQEQGVPSCSLRVQLGQRQLGFQALQLALLLLTQLPPPLLLCHSTNTHSEAQTLLA